MPEMGCGVSTNVLEMMLSGEDVSVSLIVSSMSDITAHPVDVAKVVIDGNESRMSTAREVIVEPSLKEPMIWITS